MRSFVMSEHEHLWRGFLIDLNASEMLAVFNRLRLEAKVTEYKDDSDTVHEAWNEYRMIVTVNEAHFIRHMVEHQKRDSGDVCRDCWGLLVVPDKAIVRERLLGDVKRGVPLHGDIVPWKVAAYANLAVSLHEDGTVGVRRFRRCIHCDRDWPIKQEWYQSLPMIQRTVRSDQHRP
jgi:hypothetical protein